MASLTLKAGLIIIGFLVENQCLDADRHLQWRQSTGSAPSPGDPCDASHAYLQQRRVGIPRLRFVAGPRAEQAEAHLPRRKGYRQYSNPLDAGRPHHMHSTLPSS
jgi:hypothetical protein